jgi:hypothetical protein
MRWLACRPCQRRFKNRKARGNPLYSLPRIGRWRAQAGKARKGHYPALLVSVETVEKWLTLAQQRCAYFEDLHRSGRWQRIYRDQSALQARMQSAVQDAEHWAKVLEHAMSKQKAA